LSEQRPRLVTPTFVVVSLAGLAYFVALGMLVPTLPRFVKDELGGSGTEVGIAAGAMAVTAALMRPWVGRTGDRAGRRRLVVTGASIMAVSLVGYALADSVAVLVVARLVSGIGEAMFFVGAATAIQDMAPDERRGEAASYFSLAVWGGIGIGPAIAETVRDHWDTDHVWLVAGGLFVTAAILGRWTPPGTYAEPPADRPLLHPAAIRPGMVLLLTVMGLSAFQTFLALYADGLGVSAGPIFAAYSAAVVAMRLFGATLADRRGPMRVAAAGIVVQAGGLMILALWPSTLGLYVGAVVLAVGVAPIYPAILTLVMDNTPDGERTAAVATFSLFFDLSQGLGLPVLGTVVGASSERWGFATGAGMVGLALVALLVWVEPPARHKDEPLPIVPEL